MLVDGVRKMQGVEREPEDSVSREIRRRRGEQKQG